MLNIPFWLLFLATIVTAEKVPLMIWSSNSNQLSTNQHSLNDDVFPEDLLADFPIKSHKIAFVKDDINVEQFSHSKLPFLSQLFDKNEALFFPYSTYVPEYYSNFDLIVPLKDGTTLEENENLIKSYVEQYNQTYNDGYPTIFILTGKQNKLYDNDDVKQRVRRSSKDAAKTVKVLQYPLDKDPCIYAHFSTIELKYYSENNNEKPKSNSTYQDIDINFANCTFDEKMQIRTTDTAHFQLKSTNSDVNLVMEFEITKAISWKILEMELTYDSKKFTLTDKNRDKVTKFSTIGDQFSYSCSKKIYRLFYNVSDPNQGSVEVIMNRMQIQPFVLVNSKVKFEESFDCSVWFTIPIFSSLLVCLLLVLILYFGIRALMSISTPDRFENPKSKGLIITAVDE